MKIFSFAYNLYSYIFILVYIFLLNIMGLRTKDEYIGGILSRLRKIGEVYDLTLREEYKDILKM